MSSSDPISVGVLAGPYLYEWQVRAIERLQSLERARVPLVVVDDRTDDVEAESWNRKERFRLADLQRFFQVVRKERAWTAVLAERNVAKRFGSEKPSSRRHTTERVTCLSDSELVPCDPDAEDGWTEFPDPVVTRLDAECDVIIRFGFGLIRGEILDVTDHGVLSFHPADIRRYRGMGPPVIFHDGRDVAGSTLQRLDDSIDGGEIVTYDEVDITDCETLWDVFDRVLTLQIYLLADGVSNLRDPDFEPVTVPDEELGEFYYRSQRRSLEFAARVLGKNLLGRLRRRFRNQVAYQNTLQRPPRPSR